MLVVRLVIVLIILALLVWVGWLFWPQLSVFTDRDRLNELILSAGVFGPLIFIGLQAIQVVIAPIPATIVTLAGGFIFDTFWGTVYSMIGTTLGFFIVFVISKKFGRRAIRFVVDEERMKKYDKLSSSKGVLGFIIFGFLFPFLPDAVIGYIAGLTPMRIRSLLVLSIVTRIPGVLTTNFIGSKAGAGEFGIVAVVGALLIVVLIIAHFTRGRMYRIINSFHGWMLPKPDTRDQHLDGHNRRR